MIELALGVLVGILIGAVLVLPVRIQERRRPPYNARLHIERLEDREIFVNDTTENLARMAHFQNDGMIVIGQFHTPVQVLLYPIRKEK